MSRYHTIQKLVAIVASSILMTQTMMPMEQVYAAQAHLGIEITDQYETTEQEKIIEPSKATDQIETNVALETNVAIETNNPSEAIVESEIIDPLETTDQEKEDEPSKTTEESEETDQTTIIAPEPDLEEEITESAVENANTEDMEREGADAEEQISNESQEIEEELSSNLYTQDESDFVINAKGELTAYAGTSKEIVLPSSVIKIEQNVFSQNANIISIDMSNTGITKILDNTFEQCKNLKTVKWNQKVTYIGKYAFKGCSSLEMFTSPNSVQQIDSSAFEDCSNLKSVILNDGLKSIGPRVFASTGIGKEGGTPAVIIPSSITDIQTGAFSNCDSLEKVFFDKGSAHTVTLGKNLFEGCETLKEVFLADYITSLAANTVKDDPVLEKIYIPKSVKTIDDAAISGCPKVIVYGISGSEAYNYTQKKGLPFVATAQSMGILLMPKNVEFSADYGDESTLKNQTFQMSASLVPSGTGEITYTSSNESVATVSETGIVKPIGFGTAVITASFGTYSDTSTVNVYPISYDTIFQTVFTPAIPDIGLETGLSTKVSIYSSINTRKVIPVSCFDFYTEDNEMAIVDQDGKITSTYTEVGGGVVNIIASVKNDPAKRKIEIPVPVVDREAESIAFTVEDSVLQVSECKKDSKNHNSITKITLDQGEHPNGYTFEVHAICYATSKGAEYSFAKRMQWSTSSNAYATLELSEGGDIAIVTLKPGKTGSFTLETKTNEINPVTQKVEIEIKNYAPVFSAEKVTINSKLMTTETIQIQSIDTNKINFGGANPITIDQDNFTVSFAQDEASRVGNYTSLGNCTISIKEGKKVKKGTYKASIGVQTQLRTYQIPLTIVVTDASPTVSFAQKSKFMSFYKNASATYQVNCKNAKVSAITLDSSNEDLKIEYDSLTGMLKVSYSDSYKANANNSLNRKCQFILNFEGSAVTMKKNLTIAVTQTKPVLRTNRTTTYFYEDGTNSGAFGIYDQTNKRWVDQSDEYRTGIDTSVVLLDPTYIEDVYYDAGSRTFQLSALANQNKVFSNGKKTITVKMWVNQPNWITPILVSHKLVISKEVTKPTGVDCAVTLKKKNVTLNQGIKGDYIQIPVKMSVLGYTMRTDGISAKNDYMDRDKFKMEYADGMLTISLGDTATEGVYKVPMKYTLASDLEPNVQIPANEKKSTAYITIKIVRKNPILNVTTSGKLDTIQRDQGITIQVKDIQYMNYHANDVIEINAYGPNKELFALSELQRDAKGNIFVKLKGNQVKDSKGVLKNVDLSTGKKYKIQLEMKVSSWVSSENTNVIYSKEITIKPVQSRFVCKVSGDTTISMSETKNTGNIELEVSAPKGATLMNSSVTIAENCKNADGTDLFTFNLKNTWIRSDGKILTIPYEVKKSDLKVGKTYQVKCNVTPEGNATNVKPYQIILKFKVKK